MGTRPGVVSRLWYNFLTSFRTKPRTVVGSDKYGNTYYVIKDGMENRGTDRGYVPGRAESGEWEKKHPLWEEWLRYRRADIPSVDEMSAHDANYTRRMNAVGAHNQRLAGQLQQAQITSDDTVFDKQDAAAGELTEKHLRPKIDTSKDTSAGEHYTATKQYPVYSGLETEPGEMARKKEQRSTGGDDKTENVSTRV